MGRRGLWGLLGRVCGEMLSLCGAPPQGLCKAPHDSGVCWKQFMMLLEEFSVCGSASFHPCMSRVDEGIRVRVTGRRSAGLPVYCLVSSVVGGVEVRPPLGDLRSRGPAKKVRIGPHFHHLTLC